MEDGTDGAEGTDGADGQARGCYPWGAGRARFLGLWSAYGAEGGSNGSEPG